jgi:exopolysaccharide biosynthesis WecB/TagA/CpsF family protein
MERDSAYRRALQTADFIIPDGIGVELALRLNGKKLEENLNGTDLVPILLKEASKVGKSVFLLGGEPSVALRAARQLVKVFPEIRIAGTRDGFAGLQNNDKAIKAVNNSGADILLLATGIPHQDVWLKQHSTQLKPEIVLGVGGLFDFLAGRVYRAPRIFRLVRCEWVWRLIIEPKRLFRRYVIGNTLFLLRVIHHAKYKGSIGFLSQTLLFLLFFCVVGLMTVLSFTVGVIIIAFAYLLTGRNIFVRRDFNTLPDPTSAISHKKGPS